MLEHDEKCVYVKLCVSMSNFVPMSIEQLKEKTLEAAKNSITIQNYSQNASITQNSIYEDVFTANAVYPALRRFLALTAPLSTKTRKWANPSPTDCPNFSVSHVRKTPFIPNGTDHLVGSFFRRKEREGGMSPTISPLPSGCSPKRVSRDTKYP